ncbi:hypothetical protein V6N13_014529 [Hibiscus sabdariffa]|uniref:Uncharacterized protein n=1 Tax=Hibiscus sabdariffa TaxID=183260 RepID=A0ABR2RVK6_9ROSI
METALVLRTSAVVSIQTYWVLLVKTTGGVSLDAMCMAVDGPCRCPFQMHDDKPSYLYVISIQQVGNELCNQGKDCVFFPLVLLVYGVWTVLRL